MPTCRGVRHQNQGILDERLEKSRFADVTRGGWAFPRFVAASIAHAINLLKACHSASHVRCIVERFLALLRESKMGGRNLVAVFRI